MTEKKIAPALAQPPAAPVQPPVDGVREALVALRALFQWDGTSGTVVYRWAEDGGPDLKTALSAANAALGTPTAPPSTPPVVGEAGTRFVGIDMARGKDCSAEVEIERRSDGSLHVLSVKIVAPTRPVPAPPQAEDALRAAKDAAYTERNQVVALLAKMALALGWRAGIGVHADKPGEAWEPDWRTLLCIDLPTGQASWHFHDSQKHLLDGLPSYGGEWDGHDTPEKYRRVNAFAVQADTRDQGEAGRVAVRPPPLSREARESRRSLLPPEILAGALQGRIHTPAPPKASPPDDKVARPDFWKRLGELSFGGVNAKMRAHIEAELACAATVPAAYCTGCGVALTAEEIHCDDCADDLREDEGMTPAPPKGENRG